MNNVLDCHTFDMLVPASMLPTPWVQSHRADLVARELADRHYNRQKPGTPQFVPPGSCCVFVTRCRRAFWVTSAPIAKYVKHAWPGAWMCSAFRNEGAGQASELIRHAIAHTRWHYHHREIPAYGMVTFVDPEKTPGVVVRGERIHGFSFGKAGFKHVGYTEAGLWAWQILPHEMPLPTMPFQAPWLRKNSSRRT